jgi:hypothetical protein
VWADVLPARTIPPRFSDDPRSRRPELCDNSGVRSLFGQRRTDLHGARCAPLALARRRGERGGAAVEFAIVMPIFCAVLFGTIDYGWYFYQKFTVASAVRDGIRQGVTVAETASPDPWAKAVTAATTILDQGAVPSSSVTFGPSTHYQGSGSSGTRTLWFQISYTFKPLIGFVKTPSSTISYTMVMLLEIQS